MIFVKDGLITERFSNPPKNSENYSPKEKMLRLVKYVALFLNRCVFKKSRSEFIMGRSSMSSVKIKNKSDTYIILALVSLAEFV